ACTSRRVFAANGDVLQFSSNGMLVRRKSDNWSAFTDGNSTWIDGPRGLVSRSNADRFSWEHETASSTPSGPAQIPPGRVAPPTAYPIPAITPGSTDPRVTQRGISRTICSPDYLLKAHGDSAYFERVKTRQLVRYKYPSSDPSLYEEDHFVPI